MAKGKVLLGELAEQVKLVDDRATIGSIMPDYKQGRTIVVDSFENGYCILPDQDLENFPPNRLLKNLSLEMVPELYEMTTAVQAFDTIQGYDAPGTVVRMKDGSIGYVSGERLSKETKGKTMADEMEETLVDSIHEVVSGRGKTSDFTQVMDLLSDIMGAGTSAIVSRTRGSYCLEAFGSDGMASVMADMLTTRSPRDCKGKSLRRELTQCVEKALQQGTGYFSNDLENECLIHDGPCRRAGASWCLIHPLVTRNDDAVLVWCLGSDNDEPLPGSKDIIDRLPPELGGYFLKKLSAK